MYTASLILSLFLLLVGGKTPQNSQADQAARKVAEQWIKYYAADDEKGLNNLCAPGYTYFGIKTAGDSNYMEGLLDAGLVFEKISSVTYLTNTEYKINIQTDCEYCNHDATVGMFLKLEKQKSGWMITEIGNYYSDRMAEFAKQPRPKLADVLPATARVIDYREIDSFDRTLILWIDKPSMRCAPFLSLCNSVHDMCLGAWWAGQPMLSLTKTSKGDLLQTLKISYVPDSTNEIHIDNVGLPAVVSGSLYMHSCDKRRIDNRPIIIFSDFTNDNIYSEFALFQPSYGPNHCMLLTTLLGYIPRQDRIHQYFVEEGGKKNYWEEWLFVSTPKDSVYVITEDIPMSSDSVVKTYRYNPSTYSFTRTTVRMPKGK